MRNIVKFILGVFVIANINSCTDLDEELTDSLQTDEAIANGVLNAQSALNASLQGLDEFQFQDKIWSLQEMSSDIIAGPTRGTDWFDGGAWQSMSNHSWSSTHPHIDNAWRSILSGLFNANSVLEFSPSPAQEAQGLFYRAFYVFSALDLFGQVPFREVGSDLSDLPIVLQRGDAIDLVIADLEASLANIPDASYVNPNGDVYATKNAAHTLLAKAYLNRAVYKATGADGSAMAGPYTFDSADMTQVIQNCNAVANSGFYNYNANYFDNFSPTNDTDSSELIFGGANTGDRSGPIFRRWFMTMHYNQNPSGWNGFVALTDLYNLFDDDDLRRQQDLDHLVDNGAGYNAGFLIGPQFAIDGTPIFIRNSTDQVVFTEDFSLTNSAENQGIRAVKYLPDFTRDGQNPANNDYVIFRYADVRLMKAEALLRGGTDSGGESADQIINELRTARNAGGSITGATLNDVLDERARELYWEGWRRNDQIRFNTFLGTWQEKPSASSSERLLFPIPVDALATNPNLRQNPGY
ncbi:MAG: RagB/SusD family nutrient uptake outer membrane protein [Bacteroidota bacterium]